MMFQKIPNEPGAVTKINCNYDLRGYNLEKFCSSFSKIITEKKWLPTKI